MLEFFLTTAVEKTNRVLLHKKRQAEVVGGNPAALVICKSNVLKIIVMAYQAPVFFRMSVRKRWSCWSPHCPIAPMTGISDFPKSVR